MLRMDGFEVLLARSVEHAVDLYASHEQSLYVAGGTDLLPNLKHRILAPKHLIGLGGALPQGWRTVEAEAGPLLEIGAGTRLSRLATLAEIPALAQAAGLVAGPQIRNMGTIGGNILLDTRCLYYNQSAFWRKSLGHCLKAEGDWCHVIGGPKTCVAAQSSDTVPVLLACNAMIQLSSASGRRTLSLRELYRFDGKDHLKIEPGELLTHVLVPLPGPGARGSYQKLRTRDSIDFPQLGLAIAARFDGADLAGLEIVVGAANPAPKPVRGLEALLGRPLDEAAIAQATDLVYKQTRPQAAVHGDPAWRRQMAAVFTTRGLRALRESPAR